MNIDLDMLFNLVPQAWWPVVGFWTIRAFALLIAANSLVWVLFKLDGLDGHRNAKIATMYRLSVTAMTFALALIEMLPVQLPFVRGLQRLRELVRTPHVDDLPPEDQ